MDRRLVRLTELAIVVVLVVLIIAGAWSVTYGPLHQVKLDSADRHLARAHDLYHRAAAKVEAEAAATFVSWDAMVFDTAAEQERVRQDVAARRAYRTEDHTDQAAVRIEADITRLLKRLDEAESDLKASDKEIALGEAGSLPDEYAVYTRVLRQRNQQATKGVKILRAGLKELKKDVQAYGFYALSLDGCGELMNRFTRLKGLIDAGDYAAADVLAPEADLVMIDAATWYGLGNLELTNIRQQSLDAERLLAFLSKAKSALGMLDQTIDAGVRGDDKVVGQAKPRVEEELTALSELARDNGIGAGYKTWLLTNTRRYQTEARAAFTLAEALDKQARVPRP